MYKLKWISHLDKLKEYENRQCAACNKTFSTILDMSWCSDKCRYYLENNKVISKSCTICNKEFKTIMKNKNICSKECRRIAAKTGYRLIMRKRREAIRKKINLPCQVCGFNETTDIHHEGNAVYILCPNHHALITRGIVSLPSYHISPLKT